ncbi:rhodanese-like domain-containing protein [Alcanivorax sp. 97CO-6]|jgi:rhodanese-related sulfurtransferase|nr:rhodanese-like domain-containing protein [Alcanivorax sp. 97CO-6]
MEKSKGAAIMKRYLIISIFAVLNTLCASLWAADSLSVSELKQRMQDGNAPIIIDVRDEDEYLAGHIPGAIMVPAKQMEHHLDMMEQYRKEDIVLYCQSGRRASAAATVLENAGFKNVKLLQGNYPGWESAQ